jgi:hypothetical protein
MVSHDNHLSIGVGDTDANDFPPLNKFASWLNEATTTDPTSGSRPRESFERGVIGGRGYQRPQEHRHASGGGQPGSFEICGGQEARRVMTPVLGRPRMDSE